ncbi:hypothetical protein M011DRAFT_139518 [Sporormia fimetaria CBS 119925]|uniref:Uncharacterized protein n=1 Tax=Sporormia fimetaria CBS 119925 TaxID=1340428 RepID=A0A6A6V4X5_9PLEO|nr:hypothetical protein M011DRAFT_139518 [Sporormia fimetaria CBS 119925]
MYRRFRYHLLLRKTPRLNPRPSDTTSCPTCPTKALISSSPIPRPNNTSQIPHCIASWPHHRFRFFTQTSNNRSLIGPIPLYLYTFTHIWILFHFTFIIPLYAGGRFPL